MTKKEREQKAEIVRLTGLVKDARMERDTYSRIISDIKKALGSTYAHYRVNDLDLPQEVMKLVVYKELAQGTTRFELEHIKSLQQTLRWIINPECAKDDEKMARFEEQSKLQRGF